MKDWEGGCCEMGSGKGLFFSWRADRRLTLIYTIKASLLGVITIIQARSRLSSGSREKAPGCRKIFKAESTGFADELG